MIPPRSTAPCAQVAELADALDSGAKTNPRKMGKSRDFKNLTFGVVRPRIALPWPNATFTGA